MNIVTEILQKMSKVRKPQKKFLMVLFTTILLIKVNYLNLSRYSKLSERTYRRQFHKEFHFVEFNKEAIERVIPVTATQIFAQDASFLKKSGKKTDGIDWFFNGCVGHPQKRLEISVISVIDLDANQGYTLSVKQTKTTESTSEPTKSKLNHQNSHKGKTNIDFYLQHLRETRPYLPKALKCGVFDGFYAKQKFIDGVCALELSAISKLRVDADMRYLIYRSIQRTWPS